MTKKLVSGKLVYNDAGDYEIHNDQESYIFELSKLLEDIYYNPKCNHLNIKIIQGCKTFFNENGNLYFDKIFDRFYSYHVSGEDLGTALFNLADERIEVELESEAIKGVNTYEQYFKR